MCINSWSSHWQLGNWSPAPYKKINSCVIPNSLEDLGRFLYRSPPELCLLCAPDSSATLSATCTGTIRNFMGHLHRENLISHPEPSRTWPFETSSGICIGTLRNFVCYVHRTAQQLCLLSAPEPSGTSWAICTGTLRTWSAIRNPPEPDRSRPHQASASEPSGTLSAICTRTLQHLISHLRRNPPEPCVLSAPEPSGTLWNLISSSAICTRTVQNLISFLPGTVCTGTLRNLICNLHQNSKPSGTSSAICTGTLRNLVCYLHRNPPELHQSAAPELSGTSSAIFSGTLRNLISNLHRKAPEPSETFSGTWCCSCTGSHQSFSGLKTP